MIPFLGYVAAVQAPQTRYDLSPRIDLALGAKNTMTIRYRIEHATLNNQGIGGNQLLENAYAATQSEQDIQMSDTQTVSSHIINEIHFEWQRSSTGDTPLNNTPQINGGRSVYSRGRREHRDHAGCVETTLSTRTICPSRGARISFAWADVFARRLTPIRPTRMRMGLSYSTAQRLARWW